MLKTITDAEADKYIAEMKPETIRKIVQEWHTLKQGLCWQTLLVPTGADDWVQRSIATARRLKRAEGAVRKLIYGVENLCAEARNDVRETTCGNCTGSGEVGENSCCICRGTGLRLLN